MEWDRHYAPRSKRMVASEIRELLKLLDQPDIISFAGGIPDRHVFPYEEIASAYQRILSSPSASSALQYSVSEGCTPLRAWIVSYMGSLAVPCALDNILITNGSQQALDFIGKLFIGAGDRVLVTRPTYLGALQAFNAYEPSYDILPGIDGNQGLEALAGGRSPPRLGYVNPDFRNPSGTSLTLSERQRLVEDAHALELPLIEDGAYSELRYDGTPRPTLISLDAKRCGGIDNSLVLYCGTFSKTVVPGLRVGWIAAPRAVIQKLVLIKQAADLHSSALNQMVLYEVVRQGFAERLGPIRDLYRGRRDAMLAALERHMPAGVDWTRPEGGMFIWLTLPRHLDGAVLLERAISEIRVAFVPGRAFFAHDEGANTLRLNFTLSDAAQIEEGIASLGGLLRQCISA